MNTMITDIHSLEELNGDNFIIFKHSLTCPVSKLAMNEMEQFSKEFTLTPIYQNTVQTDQQLKLEIAKKYQVKHESPQVIFVKDGKVKESISHFEIKLEKLNEISKKTFF